MQDPSHPLDFDGFRTVGRGIKNRNVNPIEDEEKGPHDEALMHRDRGIRRLNKDSIRQQDYGPDDEALMSREVTLNDENDESHLHIMSVGNSRIRKERTQFEDEYSVGRHKAAPTVHVRRNSEGFTDNKDDDHTVGSVRSSGVRRAHVLLRQRQLQEQT